jgi:serine/threonine-protein kinase
VLVAFIGLLLVAAALTWRNVRRGRGDRVTAGRLFWAFVGWAVLVWAVNPHSGHPTAELWMLELAFGRGMFLGVFTALFYLALEPAVRRRWPWRLTAWARAFSGRWRDPMVGRDLLVGLAVGCAASASVAGANWLCAVLGAPPVPTFGDFGGVIPPVAPGELLGAVATGLASSTSNLFFAFCLFPVVRREWLVWLVFLALGTVAGLTESLGGLTSDPVTMSVLSITRAIVLVAFVVLLARFGLLSLAGYWFAGKLASSRPLTLDTAAWYFPHAAVGVGVLLAMAGFCCWSATGGRRLFRDGFFADE